MTKNRTLIAAIRQLQNSFKHAGTTRYRQSLHRHNLSQMLNRTSANTVMNEPAVESMMEDDINGTMWLYN